MLAAPRLARPVATHLAMAWLRDKGAQSAVEITALSGSTLTARLRVGDPRDPDLTVERVDVAYVVSWPWRGKELDVTPTAVRLVRPRLKTSLRAGGVDVGQLRGVVDWALRQRPTTRPVPAITVVNGEARLIAPGGTLVVTGGGSYAPSGRVAANLRLAPFRQVLRTATITGSGGPVTLLSHGPSLSVKADLADTQIQAGAEVARASDMALRSDLPWSPRAGRWQGPAAVDLALRGVSGAAGASMVEEANVLVAMRGDLDAATPRQRFVGAVSLSAGAQRAAGSGVAADRLAAHATLRSVELVHDGPTASGRAAGTLTLSLDRLAGGYGAADGLAVSATFPEAAARLRDGGWSGRVGLAGQMSARGRLAPRAARGLAAALPTVGGSRPFAAAVARSLGGEVRLSAPQWRLDVGSQRARFALVTPARLESGSGATVVVNGQGAVTLAPDWRAAGAAAVSLAGGGLPSLVLGVSNAAISPRSARADLRGRVALDEEFARQAQATAEGRLTTGNGGLRLDLTGCAPLRAASLGVGGAMATDLALRLCPGPGPLLQVAGGRWRAVGRVEGGQGDDSGRKVGLMDAAGAFEAAGDAHRLSEGHITLTSARIVDRSTPARFLPVVANGAARAAGPAWQADFTVAHSASRPLLRVTAAASAGGAGRADLDTGRLEFAPGVLQPVDLTPLAAAAREVSGLASFRGWLTWGAGRPPASGGELILRDVNLTGPTGSVRGLATDIVFTSLVPLATAAGQQVRVAEIDTLLPFTNLQGTFDLADDTLVLGRAQARFAGGQVSLGAATISLHAGSRFDGDLTLDQIDVGQVLAATSLAEQVKLQTVVNGQIPFSVGPAGVTVREGRLTSVGGGRLSIARTALGASPGASGAMPAGVAQDFAYQALEDLAFDSLEARLNSLPNDRLGVIFRINGRHDPPTPKRAVIRFADVLRGHALDRPLDLPSDTRIDLTLDTSLNFGELGRALQGAWQDAIRPAATGSAKPP
jgi:hypothetical protein